MKFKACKRFAISKRCSYFYLRVSYDISGTIYSNKLHFWMGYLYSKHQNYKQRTFQLPLFANFLQSLDVLYLKLCRKKMCMLFFQIEFNEITCSCWCTLSQIKVKVNNQTKSDDIKTLLYLANGYIIQHTIINNETICITSWIAL